MPGAQPVWKLYTTGSVGGQSLTGLPALHRLRARLGGGTAVWTFDTGLVPPAGPVTLAEVYPSLFAARIAAARGPGEVKDAAQVRVTAAVLAALDAVGALARLFAPGLAPAARSVVAREEGWILGAPPPELGGRGMTAPRGDPARDPAVAEFGR